MVDDFISHEAPTRRDYMRCGGAVIGGGLLAGCTGQSEPSSTSTKTRAGPESTRTDTSTPEDESYSVTMAPVGEVTFESIPERWIAGFGMDAGGWHGLGETPESEQLFDRQRVANIINGNL